MSSLRWKLMPLFCATLLMQAAPANSQTLDPAFQSDLRRLLDVTGAAQLGTQAANLISGQLLNGLKQAMPELPDRALAIAKEVFESEVAAKAFTGPDNLIDQMVLIYAKHFTHDDVRGLLAFYSSDLGKKTIAALPSVFQEGAAAGQQWAERQTPRVAAILEARLRAEGFIK